MGRASGRAQKKPTATIIREALRKTSSNCCVLVKIEVGCVNGRIDLLVSV